MIPTIETICERMHELGFPVFDSGRDYNLNLIGLRALPGTSNAFDDRMTVLYRERGQMQIRSWPITTDPGLYWLLNPTRTDGTGILIHDRQYRRCWTLGEHHRGRPNAYPALVQNPDADVFRVWRDRNKDGTPDYLGPVYTNVLGLNCHHAGLSSTKVDKWSAACQVLARTTDYDAFMSLVNKQIAAGLGRTFSYTLLGWPGADVAAMPAG